ncbi:hypothetical protein [Candidatus Magnetominusculus xianensis]|uniref:hypothetical protein n=1 Tax=Candidatus Magnetominusculus xianensis TaxID=1748249 RepID=UPI0012EDB3FD|nr:hypothetical protein [Candidatus Magnetominusculus xianensis]MBF0402990.1 hypothetical protein [Nitrospirota bacterium]
MDITSNLVGILTHAAYVDVHRENGMFTVVFGSLKQRERAVAVSIDAFTYNVPVTLAIVAALLPFIRNKARAILMSVAFLVSMHAIYALVLEMLSFTIEGHAVIQALNKYLFLFMHRIMTRCEPFMLGLYLFSIHIYLRPPNKSA